MLSDQSLVACLLFVVLCISFIIEGFVVLKKIKNFSSQNEYRVQLLSTVIVAIVIVLLKAGEFSFVSNSLWAEDGHVFLNDAYKLGGESLFKPYAGYIHLWPRIVSFSSTFFALWLAPHVLFVGWLIACILAAWAIIKFSYELGAPLIVSVIAAVTILLPPHTDEVYFTVTNSQWFLPIYLALIMNFGRNLGMVSCIAIFVASLTGPFSVILAPFIGILYLSKSLKIGRLGLSVFLVGVLLQGFFMATSELSDDASLSLDINEWLKVFKSFFVFGSGSFLVIVIGLIYWTLFLVLFFNCFFRKESKINYSKITLLLFGGAVFAASLWSIRDNPAVASPVGTHARYYFIPYVLSAFFCLSCYTINKVVSISSLLLFLLLSIFTFYSHSRSEVYFEEYARLHEKLGGFYIPIHPRWPSYPGWGVFVKNWDDDYYLSNRALLENYTIDNGKADGRLITWRDDSDPKIFFDESILCPPEKDIGLIVRLDLDSKGWSQLFWTQTGAFSGSNSFSIFHEEGDNVLVYMIPNYGEEVNVRFDPPVGTSQVIMTDASYICIAR